MRPAFYTVEEFFHQVVDEQQFQLHLRIIHRNRKIVGNIVAEGADGTVIVRPDPFPRQVRKAVNIHRCAGFVPVGEHQFLSVPFASTVFAVAEAAAERGLH